MQCMPEKAPSNPVSPTVAKEGKENLHISNPARKKKRGEKGGCGKGSKKTAFWVDTINMQRRAGDQPTAQTSSKRKGWRYTTVHEAGKEERKGEKRRKGRKERKTDNLHYV